MGGAIIAPASVARTMLRRWLRCNGDSLVIKTRCRLSFSTTSAAREIKEPVIAAAISPNVFMEHGAMIIPLVIKLPLEMLAVISVGL